MMANRGTNAWKSEVTEIFYGIDRLTLQVREVTLNRERVLTMWSDDATMLQHALGTGRQAKSEIGIVWGLAAVQGAPSGAIHGLEAARRKVEEAAELMRSERSAGGK